MARRFRSQVDAWWIAEQKFERDGVRNLANMRAAQMRAEMIEQLSTDRWTPEGHVFSCVLNTPGVVPTHGVTKLRAQLRYLLKRGKVLTQTSDETVYWKLP